MKTSVRRTGLSGILVGSDHFTVPFRIGLERGSAIEKLRPPASTVLARWAQKNDYRHVEP